MMVSITYPAICGSNLCRILGVECANDRILYADVSGNTSGRDLDAVGNDGVGDDLASITKSREGDVIADLKRSHDQGVGCLEDCLPSRSLGRGAFFVSG
jgi:hypothetical protein